MLENELQQGLRRVEAPPELWDRIQAPPQVPRSNESSQRLVWALAVTVVLAAVALSLVRSPDEVFAIQALASDSRRIAFHCQNPAELRAWVKANTGFDVPLRAAPPAQIQLIGAGAMEGRVEVAYRAGNRDAVLVVSRANSGSANVPHSLVSGNVSSWVMSGQRFTLACNDPADLQLACKLCHLD
jgi:hypothetical protein